MSDHAARYNIVCEIAIQPGVRHGVPLHPRAMLACILRMGVDGVVALVDSRMLVFRCCIVQQRLVVRTIGLRETITFQRS